MTRRLLPLLLLLLLLAPSWAWAATFNSNPPGDAGNWNVGATWGNPGDDVEGSGFPGNADLFVISAGDTVTVNGEYPASGALGAGSVTGNFVHQTNVNTKLALGDASITVNSGGHYHIGENGVAAIDADKTADLSFTPTAAGGRGVIVSAGGTFTTCGATKDYYKLLAADVGEWAASNDVNTINNVTEITVDSAGSGWRDNDVLAIAAMGRTAGHTDTCLIAEDPTGLTTFDVDAWQGTAPTYVGVATKSLWNHQGAGLPAHARAEVLNLTRNVRIYSTSATNTAYIVFETTATADMRYTECWYLGTSTADKLGITTKTTTGSVTLVGVVVHDSYHAYYVQGTVTTGVVSLSQCGAFTLNTPYGTLLFLGTAPSGAGTVTASELVGIKANGTDGSVVIQFNAQVSLANCRVANKQMGGSYYPAFHIKAASGYAAITGSQLSGLVAHSGNGWGVKLAPGLPTSSANPISGITIYRLAHGAIGQGDVYTASAVPQVVALSNVICFGCGAISGITASSLSSICQVGGTLILDSSCQNPGDSVTAWDAGIDLMADGGVIIANGGSWRNYLGARRGGKLVLNNCDLTGFDGWLLGGDGDALDTMIAIWRYDQTEDDHRWRTERLEIRTETGADRRTASGMAYALWPLSNANWVKPPRDFRFRVPAVADTPITIKCWTKHNAAYDETKPERIVVTGGILSGIVPLGPQACTVQDVGDTVTDAAHGMVNGTEVFFATTANGLTAGTIYYVINAAANTFQVSTTLGGAAVTITSDGSNTYTARDVIGEAHSATDESYEELEITVTPTETGMLEWYVQTFGTAGTVFVDDASVSPTPTLVAEDYPGLFGPANPFGGAGVGGTRRQALQ